jgi:4-amino-4-deoxy-L-arabinose transferase-like glycosyltransferase
MSPFVPASPIANSPLSWRAYFSRWAVLLLPLLLLLLAAWRPLALPDEGRYAEVGRWMLSSGDWLTPRLDGVPFFHKPPLLYWLEAVSMQLFGVTPWAARLVVGLHACLMWGCMVLCTRHIADAATARRAAWMLGTSLAFLVGGQYLNHDMVVATWMGLAIWCFARALMHPVGVHANWARAGFLACALGVLSKGLIGVLLPGFVLTLWVLWTWQWRKVWALPWVSGVLLFLAVALPWFLLAAREHPDMLAYMFGKHQFGRYTATTFNNARPWWFYGVAVVLLMFPWVFFALAHGWQRVWMGLRLAWQRKTGQVPLAPIAQRAPEDFEQALSAAKAALVQRHWVALCWIWVLGILLFFSIPNSKLIGYALPVVPPLAVLAALWWQQHMVSRAWAGRVFASLVGVCLVSAFAANIVASRYTLRHSSADVANLLACHVAPDDVVAAVDEYPYDLPFYAQLSQPIEVLQDWDNERRTAGDNWRRELFEGADFDAQAARVLQPVSRLDALQQQSSAWVLAPNDSARLNLQRHTGFDLVLGGQAWSLYRSKAAGSVATPESPQATERKGLGRCQQQRDEQR